MIFLPGLNRQIDFLVRNSQKSFESILVIGSASEQLAVKLAKKFRCNVELIVDDYESLMNSKLVLGGEESIMVKMMSFDSTDYAKEQFDLVYAQASVSLTERKKILKEIIRILKPTGSFCVGEITLLNKDYPPFIRNVFDSSNLLPLYTGEIENYYRERNFKIEAKEDLSDTLKFYYERSADQLKAAITKLAGHEQSYYKKLINKISHESNAYLKLGGDKYIGFEALLMSKEAQ